MRILRILRSVRLPCGCFAGVYETYDGPAITIIDETAAWCRRRSHREGRVLSDAEAGAAGVAMTQDAGSA